MLAGYMQRGYCPLSVVSGPCPAPRILSIAALRTQYCPPNPPCPPVRSWVTASARTTPKYNSGLLSSSQSFRCVPIRTAFGGVFGLDKSLSGLLRTSSSGGTGTGTFFIEQSERRLQTKHNLVLLHTSSCQERGNEVNEAEPTPSARREHLEPHRAEMECDAVVLTDEEQALFRML